MKTKQLTAWLSLIAILGSLTIAPGVKAAQPATLALTNTSGDAVRINITGDADTNIQLSYLVPGAASVTTILFGVTNASGTFTNTISSGGYGIPQGSPAFVTVNGMQSPTALWPNYTSSLTLEKTSVQIALGQSVSLTASNALILAANSASATASAAVSGSKITITGLANGSSTLTLCSSNAGCGSIAVTVGGQGQTQVSFYQSNITLYNGQTQEINIIGGTATGFNVKSNSNPDSVTASISGASKTIFLYGNHTPGTATVIVCSKESDTNCANLYVTTLSTASNQLSFSQNNLVLIPGLVQTVTVTGGPDNNYFISSNSNTGVAQASLSGNVVSLTGGSNSGTNVITICSSSVNATCGSINITNNATPNTPSSTVLSFSQNVVSVLANDTSNVTIAGGTGTGYAISSNSNPTIVTASIIGASNVINLSGLAVGSSIITVCSATVSTTCSSLYVNVKPAVTAITFNQTSATLAAGEKKIIAINYATSTNSNTITANTNPSIASATLGSNGTVLIITAGTQAGSTQITVCAAVDSNNCATLPVTVLASQAPTTPTETTTPTTPAVLSEKETAATSQLEKIITEAKNIFSGLGIVKDAALEARITNAYVKALNAGNADQTITNLITNFIAYGTDTTKILGSGERAGVIGSYKKAFGKLPKTEAEWSDLVKIANGRWPGEASSAALSSAKAEFKKVYNREANMNNANDNAAVSIIAYGLRPTARNTNSEKAAIKTFKAIYGHNPSSSLAWDIVRAIAYSGAKK